MNSVMHIHYAIREAHRTRVRGVSFKEEDLAGSEAAPLPKTAGRISRRRDVRSRRGRSGVRGDFPWGRLRQADPYIHFQMLFRTARAIAFSRIFVAQAGKLIAAVDAVAVTGR